MNRLRMAFAVGGFLLALLSIAYDDRRLAWGAMALLAGSLLARLWLRKRGGSEEEGGPPL
jgi:hypothetical protein